MPSGLARALTDTRAKCDGLEEQIAARGGRRVGAAASHGGERRAAPTRSARHRPSRKSAPSRAEMTVKDPGDGVPAPPSRRRRARRDGARLELRRVRANASGLAARAGDAEAERAHQRARLDGEIDRFRTEASENKGRADALLAQQAVLIADVKEERHAPRQETRGRRKPSPAARLPPRGLRAREDRGRRRRAARAAARARPSSKPRARARRRRRWWRSARAGAEKRCGRTRRGASRQGGADGEDHRGGGGGGADAAADEAEAKVEALHLGTRGGEGDAAQAMA